jgi:hypothetical protein
MVTPGQQHVFYRGTDGAIKHIFWNAANECPAGGSHSPSGEEYVLPRRIRQDQHNDRDWRFCIKCFGLVSTRAIPPQVGAEFWTVDSAVVRNADFSGLPSQTGDGLVILGWGWTDFFLAWMPLGLSGPRLQDTLYYASDSTPPWTPNVEKATGLFKNPKKEVSDENRISLAWLKEPQRWILLYGRPDAVIARLSTDLRIWSEEIRIVSPDSVESARDLYSDRWSKLGTHPYGPSILTRFTEWDPATGVLGIYFLISLSKGYQVHVMHTLLQLTPA